jgi:hypothetical protein
VRNLENDFLTAWKAGTDADALLELVRRHRAKGLSGQDAYDMLERFWLERGYDRSAEPPTALQDNLEWVLEKTWYSRSEEIPNASMGPETLSSSELP